MKDNVVGNEKKNFQYQHRRMINKTKNKIVAITICLVFDLFIDLYHVVSQYISQYTVTMWEIMQHPMMTIWLKIQMEL